MHVGFLPGVGLRRLQDGETLPGSPAASPSVASLISPLVSPLRSSSALSSIADSLSEGSGEVTFTSTLVSPGWGRAAAPPSLSASE